MLGFSSLTETPIASLPDQVNKLFISSILASLALQSNELRSVYLEQDISLLNYIEMQFGTDRNFSSSVSLICTIPSNNIVRIIDLASDVYLTMEAIQTNSKFLLSDVFATLTNATILDVDGNTDYSPGGYPEDGFYPSSNVIFVLALESFPQIFKQITSDSTITSYSITDTFGDLIQVNQFQPTRLDVTVDLPRSISQTETKFYQYKQFIPNEVAYTYSFKFDATVIDLTSQEFSILGDSKVKLKLINKIVYLDQTVFGLVEVGKLIDSTEIVLYDLFITSADDIIITATCDASIAPTPDYITSQQDLRLSNLVDSTPEISLTKYSRQNFVNESWITVTSSMGSANYRIIILPDFSYSKKEILEIV